MRLSSILENMSSASRLRTPKPFFILSPALFAVYPLHDDVVHGEEGFVVWGGVYLFQDAPVFVGRLPEFVFRASVVHYLDIDMPGLPGISDRHGGVFYQEPAVVVGVRGVRAYPFAVYHGDLDAVYRDDVARFVYPADLPVERDVQRMVLSLLRRPGAAVFRRGVRCGRTSARKQYRRHQNGQ